MTASDESRYLIKEVWADNLDEEMAVLRDLIDYYPYIAMDTEFPGVVARPVGNFKGSSDYHYQTLRCNVDLLKIIQLGLTFTDEKGFVPPSGCTWQFNFKFNLNDDMYAQDSIDLLAKSGINFEKHERYGIDVQDFGELLISSGIVLMDNVKWISFHSGYDFGYLLKVLTCSPLPADENQFFELLRAYFPCIYDIKYLMKSCKNLKGGLQDVADDLQVVRIGMQHQAGSDSLLTSKTFFKMRKIFFEDHIDDEKYLGYLYGLGAGVQQSTAANPTSAALTITPVPGTVPPTSTAITASATATTARSTLPVVSVPNPAVSSSQPTSANGVPSGSPGDAGFQLTNSATGQSTITSTATSKTLKQYTPADAKDETLKKKDKS